MRFHHGFGGVLLAAVFLLTSCSTGETAFDRTTANLQPGGDYYLYLSGKEINSDLNAIPEIVKALREIKNPNVQNVAKILERVLPLILESGIKKIDGFGESSLMCNGLYSNRLVYDSKNAKDNGYFWNYAGRNNSEFKILQKIPENAILFTHFQFDFQKFYAYLKTTFEKNNDTESLALIGMLETSAASAGFPVPGILESLGNEVTIIFTSSSSKNPFMPFDVAYVIKTKNDFIFRKIKASIPKSQLATVTDNTIVFNAGINRLEIAGSQNCLTVSSGNFKFADGKKIRSITANSDFIRYSKGIELKGIGISYITPNWTKTLFDSPIFKQRLLYGIQNCPAGGNLNVATVNDNGFVYYGNSDLSLTPKYLQIVPFLIRAGNSLVSQKLLGGQSRSRAQSIRTVSNLKQIGTGLMLYSADHNDKLPQGYCAKGLAEIGIYIPDMRFFSSGKAVPAKDKNSLQEKNSAFVYLGEMPWMKAIQYPGCTPLAFEKPDGKQKSCAVLFADGHVQTISGTFLNCKDVIRTIVRKFPQLKGEPEKMLLDRAGKADRILNYK